MKGKWGMEHKHIIDEFNALCLQENRFLNPNTGYTVYHPYLPPPPPLSSSRRLNTIPSCLVVPHFLDMCAIFVRYVIILCPA